MGLVEKLETPVQALNNILTQIGSPALLLYFRIYVAAKPGKYGLALGDVSDRIVQVFCHLVTLQ